MKKMYICSPEKNGYSGSKSKKVLWRDDRIRSPRWCPDHRSGRSGVDWNR